MAITENTETRKIKTLHFGEITVESKHIFNFENGLLGFENLKEFVLISEEETVPFKWLISLETPEIGFPLLSPWYINLEYEPGKEFDIESEVMFIVVTLGGENGIMTANMKAPVILNVVDQAGKQIILPMDTYSTNLAIPMAVEE